MPELGDYTAYVISSYVATIVLLAAIIGLSWRRSRRIKRALEDIERG
ncbi:heme exporter protein D [Loktanella sp. DSM 29012]|nr:heme exporter protein CcmD [Loktanella sp. DSM 29012]SEQ19261.1 heme exporter protein D [Loktanella sp. DSM 29012]